MILLFVSVTIGRCYFLVKNELGGGGGGQQQAVS